MSNIRFGVILGAVLTVLSIAFPLREHEVRVMELGTGKDTTLGVVVALGPIWAQRSNLNLVSRLDPTWFEYIDRREAAQIRDRISRIPIIELNTNGLDREQMLAPETLFESIMLDRPKRYKNLPASGRFFVAAFLGNRFQVKPWLLWEFLPLALIAVVIASIRMLRHSRNAQLRETRMSSSFPNSAVQIGLSVTEVEQLMGSPQNATSDETGRVLYEYSTMKVTFRNDRVIGVEYLYPAREAEVDFE